jgi:hypothetical protein
MRKLDIPVVAMAVLYIDPDHEQHANDITSQIIESDLTELGYKGKSPERTVDSQLRNSAKYSKCFWGGYKASFRLNREEALNNDDFRVAAYALSMQSQRSELNRLNAVEFTFIGYDLASVRNYRILTDVTKKNSIRIKTVEVPEVVSREALEEIELRRAQ